MKPPTLTLPQEVDLPPRREVLPDQAAITLVSARSRDTRDANSIGQDFIAYCYDESRIAFALCDGVSQSFYGDLASRFLGTRLVAWLWTSALLEQPDAVDQADQFLTALDSVLHVWTADATTLVDTKPIRANLPEMQRIALDRKRTSGSESMFVAGLVDRAAGRLALCWMGDSRLHLWDADHQPIDLPGAAWETRERWSSRRGPKNGTPRGCILPIGAIQRITAHSDGVGPYVDRFAFLAQDSLIAMVDDLRAAPASDDVSVLDLDLHVPPEFGGWQVLKTPAVQLISDQAIGWNPVPFADSYRIAVDDGHQPFTDVVQVDIHTTDLHYRVSDLLAWTHEAPYPVTCRVQALNEYTLPSAWSAPITLTMPAAPRRTVAEPDVYTAAYPSPETAQATVRSAMPDDPTSEEIPEAAYSDGFTDRRPPVYLVQRSVSEVITTIVVVLLALGLMLGGTAYVIWYNTESSIVVPQ